VQRVLHVIEPAGIFWALKPVNLPDFKQTQRFIKRRIMANPFSIDATANIRTIDATNVAVAMTGKDRSI
jgi:hypothetical protein